MIMLAFFLLAALPGAASDPRSNPVAAEFHHLPVVAAHNRCLTQNIGTTRPVDPKLMALVIERCRIELRTRMDGGEFPGISRRASSGSRRRVEAVLDGTAAQFSLAMTQMPSTEEVTARAKALGIGVTVYDPVVPQYDRYSACVSAAEKKRRVGRTPNERVESWKRAIASCRTLKAQMAAEADIILARQPDFQDTAKRRSAILAMFDGHDEMVIKAAAVDWMKPTREPQ